MLRIIRYSFSLLIIGILLYYIYLNRKLISFSDIVQHKMTIAASMMMLMATFLACGFGWVLILKKMRLKASTGDALRVWFLSQLGKYIPGKVWVVASRLYFLPGEGRRLEVGYSILLELVLVNVAGLCVFMFSLIFWDRSIPGFEQNFIKIFILFSACFLLLYPKILERMMNTILRWLKKKSIEIRLSFRAIIELFVYYILCWSIYGLSFGILASAFTEVNLKMFVVFAGMYVFSIVIGFITVIAPSGLGVREGVLFVLLNTYVDAPVATYLSIVSRIWFTFVELGMIVFFTFWIKRGSSKRVVSYNE